VKHFASSAFWHAYRSLPSHTREVADKNFALLKKNPRHPSLNLKKVDRLWSVRIGMRYRALGVDVNDGVLWFWIGSHADYDRLIG
jgi:hypothetical protein